MAVEKPTVTRAEGAPKHPVLSVIVPVYNVENYLDAAVMAKLETVTIIHGKGTGALRKAVHEILRRSKAVKSFRLGRYGEGEAGVTVVELK